MKRSPKMTRSAFLTCAALLLLPLLADSAPTLAQEVERCGLVIPPHLSESPSVGTGAGDRIHDTPTPVTYNSGGSLGERWGFHG